MNYSIELLIKEKEKCLKYIRLQNEYGNQKEVDGWTKKIRDIDTALHLLGVESDESEQPAMKMVGNLKTVFGLNGYDKAEIGHPVYEKGDRYVIFLTSEKYPALEVPFYKQHLHKHIEFIKP